MPRAISPGRTCEATEIAIFLAQKIKVVDSVNVHGGGFVGGGSGIRRRLLRYPDDLMRDAAYNAADGVEPGERLHYNTARKEHMLHNTLMFCYLQ